MKIAWLSAAALVAITACNGPSEDTPSLKADCEFVLSDPELSGELAEAATTPEAACACLEAHIAGDAGKEEKIGLFFHQVAAAMKETGTGAEDTASRLVAQSMMPGETPEGPRFADTLPVFNNVFERLMDEIEDGGGACPAVPAPE